MKKPLRVKDAQQNIHEDTPVVLKYASETSIGRAVSFMEKVERLTTREAVLELEALLLLTDKEGYERCQREINRVRRLQDTDDYNAP